MGARKAVISGKPDYQHVSTSFTERQNLAMRMSMRRFTRLTNAFAKKVENHEAAVALHFMHYNFACVHQTLRVTPGYGSWRCRLYPDFRGNRWFVALIFGCGGFTFGA
jgi:hypothetical protein